MILLLRSFGYKTTLLTALLLCAANIFGVHGQSKGAPRKNNPFSPSPNVENDQANNLEGPALQTPDNYVYRKGTLQYPTVARQTYKPIKNTTVRSWPLTDIYKVGIGDVILVSLKNNAQAVGYFRVRGDGTIDFPLASENITVSGQTVDEITNILKTGIKLFEDPQIEVKVCEFVSHKITITGLVSEPGEKSLQREAVPLYVVRAVSLVQPQATKVFVTRSQTSKVESYNLNDSQTENILVYPGDLIEFTADR